MVEFQFGEEGEVGSGGGGVGKLSEGYLYLVGYRQLLVKSLLWERNWHRRCVKDIEGKLKRLSKEYDLIISLE